MSDFTIEQLEALEEGTTPGSWAAIADHPYISIVIANDIDQIHAPIADITDGTTDEPEVDKHHELFAAAPALVDALIAEKRAHQETLHLVRELWSDVYHHGNVGGASILRHLTRILEADNG